MQPVWKYIAARLILLFHYDKSYFLGGRYFAGEKKERIAAPGWEWVVDDYISCRKNRVNLDVPWPVSSRITIIDPENITFHPDDLHNFQGFGVYYQAFGRITIGRGTYIAPNVGIITSNHSIENLDEHDEAKPVTLGERCWIGMNTVILPGVTLGDHVIVGAGSVVTHSFPDGHCVIAGNPAKLLRVLKES